MSIINVILKEILWKGSMIGKLKGIIEEINEQYILLDVSGVCYLVFISAFSRDKIGDIGDAASLFIETHVREDHIHLYGFASKEEQEWFNLLTTVKGVGTKMGLAFLSTMPPSEIALALSAGDAAALTKISGVGKKLAERTITELKDKVGTLPTSGLEISSPSSSPTSGDQNSKIIDASSALTNLGYGRSEAFMAVSKIANEQPDISVEDLIRQSLKEM